MLPVLDLRDLPPGAARGEAYGRVAAPLVARSLETYRWLLPAVLGRRLSDLASAARAHHDAAGDLDTELADEVLGIATGANVDPVDVMTLNARSELMLGVDLGRGECTTVTRPGMLGQTWDWFVRQRDACVAVRTDRYVAFTEAGMPAKIGINAAGIGVTLNFLSTTVAPTRPGVPVHALLHAVLERCETLESATELLVHTPVSASAAIVVADARSAVVTELAPDGRSSVVARAATAVHTNHCSGAALAGTDVRGFLLEDSKARSVRAQQLVDCGLPVDRVLADTGGAHPIDVPVHPAAPPLLQVGTVAGVVIDLEGRRMRIAPGRPSEVGWCQEIDLAS